MLPLPGLKDYMVTERNFGRVPSLVILNGEEWLESGNDSVSLFSSNEIVFKALVIRQHVL